MVTARVIVTRALRQVGAIASGEVPSADEAQEALDLLNDMLDAWSLEDLLIISETLTTQTLTVLKETYTIGASGEINITWPSEIEQAQLIVTQITPNLDLPLKILNAQEYGLLRIKQLESTYPQALWLHTTFPLGTLHIWPLPTQGNQIRLWTKGIVASFAALSTDVTLGRGYSLALQRNLAIELAPEYGRVVTPEMQRLADDAKIKIKRSNTKVELAYVDTPAGMGRDYGSYNWLTDRGAY